MVLEVVWSRASGVSEEFHALHWNMFCWLGACIMLLRGFLFGCAERVVAWGFTPWLRRAVVEHGIYGRAGVWGGGSTMFGFFRRVVRWVQGRGLGVYLGVSGGKWSFTGVCDL